MRVLNFIYDLLYMDNILIMTEEDWMKKVRESDAYRHSSLAEDDEICTLMENCGVPATQIQDIVIKDKFFSQRLFRVLYKDQNLQLRHTYGYL